MLRSAALPVAFALSMTALAAPATPEPVVEAERAFQRSVAELGFRNGFLAHVADDAITFSPHPSNAREGLLAAPDDGSGKDLAWWPLYAGISEAGDFGFTAGGASIKFFYITVWGKQADGQWKWIYDGGPGQLELSKTTPDSPVDFVPAATATAGSAETALAEIAVIEAEIATESATNAAAAHEKHLAPDGRVIGSGYPPSIDATQRAAEFARWPTTQVAKPQGGAAAPGGDMAYTYGELRWTVDGEQRWGHYVRVWQKRADGWKMVLDAVLRSPPPIPN